MNEKTNKRRKMKGVALNFSKYLFLMVLPFLYQSCSTRSNDKKAEQDTEISIEEKEMSAFEKNGLKEGFYKETYKGFCFLIPQFLKDGIQEWDLHHDPWTSYTYESDGKRYIMYITITESTMEEVLWEEYDRDRHDCGDTTWDEIKNNPSDNTLTKITDDYIIADNNDGVIVLVMKNGKLCGHVTFQYPEGAKEIADETIIKTLDATMESIRTFGPQN